MNAGEPHTSSWIFVSTCFSYILFYYVEFSLGNLKIWLICGIIVNINVAGFWIILLVLEPISLRQIPTEILAAISQSKDMVDVFD